MRKPSSDNYEAAVVSQRKCGGASGQKDNARAVMLFQFVGVNGDFGS